MKRINLHPLHTILQPSLVSNFNCEGKDILHAFQEHKLKEKLYNNSCYLYQEFKLWEKGKLDQNRKMKLINSLYKFGLKMRFFPISIGLWSETSTIDKKELQNGIKRRSIKRISRLDPQIMQQLILKAEKINGISSFLKFTANHSIYEIRNELRFHRYDYKLKPTSKIHKVKVDPILKVVLAYCKFPKTGLQITHFLKKYFDNAELRKHYLRHLIGLQIIQSNLHLSLSEGDPLSRLIENIQKIKNEEEFESHDFNALYGNLVKLKLRLNRINHSSKIRVSAYKALRKHLINMGLEIDGRSFPTW